MKTNGKKPEPKLPDTETDVFTIFLTIEIINGFIIWSEDIYQDFVQSDDLKQDVCLIPPKEFRTGTYQVLKLVKPLYGLADSRDHWHMTLRAFICEVLEIINATIDIALYFEGNDNSVS